MLTLDDARQWYPEFDPVHGFDHIERVYHLCKRISNIEGADAEIVLTAALLHDCQGSAPDGAERLNHHIVSAEFAEEVLKAESWKEERIKAVQHCIRAHRFRNNGDEPATLEAKVLFDADKLDVIGAIGAARTIGYAIKAGQPTFAEPSEQFKQTGQEQPGEAHSAYHEYLFKLRKIASGLYTPTGRRMAEERQRFLNQFFDELAAECRAER